MVIDQVKKAACETPFQAVAMSTREVALTNGLGNLLANLVAVVELGDGKQVGHLRELIRQMYLSALRKN